MRYPAIVLAVLALFAIGAASARDWEAGPSTRQSAVPVIVLKPAPKASVRASGKKLKADKKVAAPRTVRRSPRSSPPSTRPSAVTPAGRGGPPAAAPGRARADGARTDDDGGQRRQDPAATPTRRPAPKPVAGRQDDGAAPVPAPAPATAGGGEEGEDGNQGDGGDGVDSDVGGDADD